VTGSTALCELAGHGRGVGKTEPEHAAREELPVPVHEFSRELGLADAAQPRHRVHDQLLEQARIDESALLCL
jgi:hypothetical protein